MESLKKKEFHIPNSNFFKILQSEQANYVRPYYKVGEFNVLPIAEYPYSSFPQNIIFYNKQIFIHLNSSGILYKSKAYNKNDSSILFERIDSTSLNRYNVNSYSFLYNDTLFNIGGYGFWRWNGQLRYFKEINKDLSVYEKNSYLNYIGIIISWVTIIILLIFLYFNNRYKIIQSYKVSNISLFNVNQVSEIMFTGLESSFIYHIIKNKNDLIANTSILELNSILGISKKSFDVQKKKRSDFINAINKKWNLINQTNGLVLVNRIKLESDKRVVEYYINPTDYVLLEKYLV